jgi:hypothetical protein
MLIPQRGRNISDHFRAVRTRNIQKSFAPLRMTMLSPGYLNRLNQL